MPLDDLPFPLDHLGIAVDDLETGSLPYRTLGLPQPHPDEEVAGQQVAVRTFQSGATLLELLTPTGTDSPIARFLERRGPGLHHLALRVDDLDAEIARLQAEGARFIDPTPRQGRGDTRVVFLHPRWGAGVLIELVEYG
jgi:methylmalonyl-CoA/ethylmalonyl-CoA epimerase